MDILSILGVIIGFGAIIVGQYLEGGELSAILNPVALLIVLGGTLGAVMLQTPLKLFLRAFQISGWVFRPPSQRAEELIVNILEWSKIARREGLLGLETIAETEVDRFSRRGLQLLVDGNEPEDIRKILELDIELAERRDLLAAKVFESMGGYAPTIGILGAVMGLIQVMGNLADPSSLGSGIAVAFVATIYGIGLANLFFLPFANKLKVLIRGRSYISEMVVEGLIGIAEGENPRNIEVHLQSYLD
ncbi:MotA/TolQ/ExbB proton channel [Nitrosococcus halophilus Nc 4]|uniref:MotA/TolQ/ExbB proton channel n=1 Tax=Nitrosococcus halophilus (strain Nc4) TaxID=472759 RepID=D5C243_NITHN|nr:flagellar motor protein [Nitrosococcus halophilus]ADE16631.1 MotA/TolQ/ExbB proton channel [Nitrosococcus halophilus Nc 4]